VSCSAVTLRRTSVLRNDQRLLDRVDLDVRQGGAVVLQGSNGAGKTTLLRVIAGLMAPTEGAITVFGEEAPLSTVTRRRIAAALDEPAFWPWMTAHGVLRTVADLGGHPKPDTAALLAEFGLDHARFALRRSKRVGKFSQGMRKRLQVAAALSAPCDLLLLDEPTASLDDEGTELVWAALRRRKDAGMTLLVASHDAEAAPRIGAALIRLELGVVVAHEAAAES
jgi:ABC-type multidrug transport system ATPase subunit